MINLIIEVFEDLKPWEIVKSIIGVILFIPVFWFLVSAFIICFGG